MSFSFPIPKILKDPALLASFMQDQAQHHPDLITPNSRVWHPLALSDGFPGILLYLSVLQNKGLDEEEAVHQYVLKIKETLENEGLPYNLSLFAGVSGICFALQEASMGGKRYQRFLSKLQAVLLQQVNHFYLDPIRENIRCNRPSSSTLHDVIQGVAGIGRYALDNLFDPGFEKLSKEIVKTLIDYTHPLVIEGKQVPGWYLSESDMLNIVRNPPLQKGNFNLGLAHGIPGILSFLSIALLRGVEIEGQKEAILKLAEWIQSRSFLQGETIRWGHQVSWEEETTGLSLQGKKGCRDAWCYGSPGVSRSLYLAGKSLSNKDIKNFSVRAFKDIFTRTREEWFLPGSAICHGIAGLLLITNEMSKEEGNEGFSKEVKALKELILSDYNPEYPFGFKDKEVRLNGDPIELNKPGLLEGAAGILLTLSTLDDQKRNWHLPFLIHV